MDYISSLGALTLSGLLAMIPPNTPAPKMDPQQNLEKEIYNLGVLALQCGEYREMKVRGRFIKEYLLPDADDNIEPFFALKDIESPFGEISQGDIVGIGFGNDTGIQRRFREGFTKDWDSLLKEEVMGAINNIYRNLPLSCNQTPLNPPKHDRK